MVSAIATATELKNNFGKYLDMVVQGGEVIVTKNGKTIGRFIPQKEVVTYLTDSLVGILKGDYDLDAERNEYLQKKYQITD